MRQLLVKSLAPTLVAMALLAGCGGGGGDDNHAGGGGTAPPPAAGSTIGTTVESLLAFMNRLIANTNETDDPVPLDATPLPVDDAA
jgi:hypothetical protein